MTPTTDEARYAGSEATVVRRGRTTVVLSDGPAGTARAVWDGLSADSPVTAVLDALAGLPGTSLTTLPPFAAVTVSDDGAAHVLVRGRFRALLATPAGDEVVDGADVATWHERRVASVTSVVLGTHPRDAAAVLADPDAWPLVAGVVRADEVALEVVPRALAAGPATEAAVSVPSAPETEVAAVPVPSEPEPEPAPARPMRRAGLAPALTIPEVETVLPVAEPELELEQQHEPLQVQPKPEPELRLPARHPAPQSSSTDDLAVVLDATQAGPVDVADDGYAHLWGATVMRTVEDAAVRPDSEDDEVDPAAPPAPEAPPAAPVPAPVPVPPAAQVVTPEAGGLIAGIPRSWSTGLAVGATPSAPAPADPQMPASPSPTELPATQPTATEPAPREPAPAASPSSDDDVDHDGHTIMSSELAHLRSGAAPARDAPASAVPSGAGPQVLALTCVHGHANPPSRVDCRTCGAPLEGEAGLAVRPVLGRVHVAGGPVVVLDRPVVVGRRPRSPRSSAGEMPRLVTVASPNQDVSRSHVEVRLEGWHVLVTDLATTNGTVLHRGGQSPQRLHPGEATLVVDGDVVDLGDGATLTFEEIW